MQRLGDLSAVDKPLIIAHRGAWGQVRENTLEAFEHAMAIGTDAVEFDVRRTADGVLVIHHDETIRSDGQPIRALTYQNAAMSAKDAGYHLPTLQETVALCHNRIAMDVELKERGYEEEAVKPVLALFDPGFVVFTSFHDQSVKKIKNINKRLNVGLLLDVDRPLSVFTRISELFPARRLLFCEADFVAPSWRLLHFGFMERMRRINKPVFVWTVDDRELARKLCKDGAAGIITNKAEEMIGLFKK